MSAIVVPDFNDSFDRELAEWFARRNGVWSGTAAELLAATQAESDARSEARPQSVRALYAYFESRGQTLRSFGIDVSLRPGPPRMLSLRPWPAGTLGKKPSSSVLSVPIGSDPYASLTPSAEARNSGLAGSPTESSATENPNVEALPRPDSAARFVSGRYAEKDSTGGRLFKNTGEALSVAAEMREQIKRQNLDLKAAIELVVNRTQEMTQCGGTAVGLVQQNVVIYPARTGIGVSMVGLDLHANFFQSCVRTGGALQLRDAQRHPLLGAMCQLEGIKSLIIVPIFHNREVVGAMEFFYKEMRTFSTGEVMDLELIAGVVWENLSFAGDIKGAEQEEREVDGKMAGDDNTKALIPGTAEAVVRTSEAQRIAAAPNRLAKAWKKVWKNAPTVTENVASIEPRAEAEIGEPEDSSQKDIGSQKSSSS